MNFIQILIGIPILAILLLYVFYAVRRHILVREQHLIQRLTHEHQEELLKITLARQEEDRKKIALELHDTLNSQLVAAKMNLQSLSREQKEERAKSLIAEAIAQIDEVLDSARRVTRSLAPPLIETDGLSGALIELCKRTSSPGLQVIFKEDDQEPSPFPNDKALHIYRIIQEIINNYIKHSEGTIIFINFYWRPHLTISIVDNGKSFQYRVNRNSTNGQGLSGIQYRLEAISAEIDSSAGPPNTTFITVPLTWNKKITSHH